MNTKKKIIGICGSASQNSGNLTILKYLSTLEQSEMEWEIIEDLTKFPHFKTELTDENVPEKITDFRNKISNAEGVIICTPEYIFSIPSGLKNLLEWCVSTTVFSEKPVGLITASASGLKAHEELQLIMKTLQSDFTEDTTLLIQGIKGKIAKSGEIIDEITKTEIHHFITSFKQLTNQPTVRSSD